MHTTFRQLVLLFLTSVHPLTSHNSISIPTHIAPFSTIIAIPHVPAMQPLPRSLLIYCGTLILRDNLWSLVWLLCGVPALLSFGASPQFCKVPVRFQLKIWPGQEQKSTL